MEPEAAETKEASAQIRQRPLDEGPPHAGLLRPEVGVRPDRMQDAGSLAVAQAGGCPISRTGRLGSVVTSGREAPGPWASASRGLEVGPRDEWGSRTAAEGARACDSGSGGGGCPLCPALSRPCVASPSDREESLLGAALNLMHNSRQTPLLMQENGD